MNLSGKVTISPEAMARQLEEETVILDLASGTYFGLDAVGTFVWQRMAQGLSLREICTAVVAAYAVSEGEAERDVLELAHVLQERRLIDGA